MGSGLAKPHGVRRLLSHRSSTSAAELSCPQPLAKSTESKPAEPLVKKSCLPALSQESFAEAKSLLTEAAKVGQSDALLPYADRLVLSLRTLKSKENVNSEVVGELLAFLQSQMAPEIRQSQPDFAHQWATRIAESKFANFVPQWLLSSASFQFAPDHPQVYHCRLVLQILRDAAELSGGEMVAKICRFGLIGMLLGLLTKEHFTEEKIKTSPTIELVGLTVASLLHICFRRQFQETRWLFNSGNGVVKFLPLASVSSESSDLRAMTAVLLAYGICPNQIAFLFSPVCILYVVLKLLRRAIESKDRRIAGLTVQEITEAIAVAAVNDEVKTKLPKFGGLEIIQSLIERPGNETELTATVKTIWILSFSPQMHDRLRNVAGLLQKMDELSSAEDLNESLIEAANGFCWNVREQFELDIDIKTIPADGPILLSFHRGCQPIVRRLNNLLQSAGYKTLLGLGDGKYPAGNTMLEAVRSARVLVVFASEDYKFSCGCRTEFDYANRWTKEMLVVRSDRQFTTDSWMVTATVILDCLGLDQAPTAVNTLMSKLGSRGKAERPIISWTTAEVQSWVISLALTDFKGRLGSLDGRLLTELNATLQRAPDTYYSALQKELGVDSLTDILIFTSRLTELFKPDRLTNSPSQDSTSPVCHVDQID